MDRETGIAVQIEAAVRARAVAEVKRLIPRFLKRSGRDRVTAQVQAAKWFQRLGLHQEGIFILLPNRWAPQLALDSAEERGRYFWIARLFNLNGNSVYAQKLAERLRPETSEEYRVLGNILLANFRYADALPHFQRAWELAGADASYEARVGALGIADCLAGLGKFREAVESAASLSIRDNERLLLGIRSQVVGEYLALAGEWEPARRALERAREFFPVSDRSPDAGIFFKWRGYVHARTGNQAAAVADFSTAVELLSGPGKRAEGWLEVLRLKERVGLANLSEKLTLLTYPGQSFADQPEVTLWNPDDEYRLFPQRDEWERGGTPRLHLPKELQLLGILRLAGENGINLERLYGILYPDDLAAYPLLNGRIRQLLRRLRQKYGVACGLHQQVLRFEDWAAPSATVELLRELHLPRFVERSAAFTAVEFANHYGLRKMGASLHLRKMKETGLLKQSSAGRAVHYTRA